MVRWFAHNPIAANLVMVVVLLGGLTTLPQLEKEFFPQRKLNQISVSVSYPGANPSEVEKQVVQRIEEAIADIDGIDEMRSTASEGTGLVMVDVSSSGESQRVLNEIKSRVEGINTFPGEAERPLVTENTWRSRMISLTLAADLPETRLKELGETIREEIAALPHVSIVELRSPRNDELAIEVSEDALRRHGLSFDAVADAVRAASLSRPGGKLQTADGDVSIQTRQQAYTADDFADIVVVTTGNGGELRVGDFARVIDGFEEVDVIGRFDGRDSYSIDVYVSNNPDVLKTSAAVRTYVDAFQTRLPPGAELRVWRDMSVPFKDRFETLIRNGLGGLVLVYLLLLLFLRPLLAFWVCTGIGVAFLGAIWLLPVLGTSLNMVSLFAFILILGIVVDDAIIVGESIYSEQSAGRLGVEGAIHGVQSVIKPVCFAVVSTMLFFVPFYFLPEEVAEPPNLADVVMLALAFSLFESLFILPAHLAHMAPEQPGRIRWLGRLESARERFAHGMEHFTRNHYQPLLERLLAWRGLTLVGFVMTFVLVMSVLVGGWMKSSFFPRVPGDYIVVNVSMQEGTPFSEVTAVMQRVADAGRAIQQQLNSPGQEPLAGSMETAAYDNAIRVTLELINSPLRDTPVKQISDQWKQAVGPITNARDVNFSFTFIPLGQPIELQILAQDLDALRAVSAEAKQRLLSYPGVFNVRDSLENPLPEIELSLRPQAELLGVRLGDVARQVRQAFYGEEVQRIPRLREDVRVMVRYPLAERRSLESLRDLRIRTGDGREVPFDTVAQWTDVDSYSTIERIDRKRVARVTADLQSGHSVGAILDSLFANDVLHWQQRYPGVSVQKEGEQKQQADFLARISQLMLLSLVLIYGLMAVVFRSYWQPVLIMTAIPFGFVGGLIGHIILQQELAMFSMLGMIACAGVVVNDNLVLIDRINQLRDAGRTAYDAAVEGARQRFRPIILTSLTTFIGLTPIILEGSTQAQFLKPMVIALAFGVLLATTVTLLFVPCLYVAAASLKQRVVGAPAERVAQG